MRKVGTSQSLFSELREATVERCQARGKRCEECHIMRPCLKSYDGTADECGPNGELSLDAFTRRMTEFDDMNTAWWVPFECLIDQAKEGIKDRVAKNW